MSVHEIMLLIACTSTQISLRIFKVLPDLFDCSHTLQSMDVDKDKTKTLDNPLDTSAYAYQEGFCDTYLYISHVLTHIYM